MYSLLNPNISNMKPEIDTHKFYPPPPPQKNNTQYQNRLNLSLMKTGKIYLIFLVVFFAFHAQAQTKKPFITTWETTTANESITIPTAGIGYSYTVNWGDGSTDNTTHTGAASHTYSKAGTYRVTISGTFPRIRFGTFDDDGVSISTRAADQIRTVEQWGDQMWAFSSWAFAFCSNLTINATDTPDLSNTMSFSQMFYESSLNGDISKWNVSSVTNMQAMFLESSFNGDISEWDISSITNMRNMFLSNTSMSSENYDKLLIGWSTLNTKAGETRIPSNITFSPPDLYSCRGKQRRDTLTMRYSWNITGDESVPIRTDEATLPAVTAPCQIAAADELNAPTAKNSCEEGMGTTVTAAHNIPADVFPITSDTLITWTYTDAGKSIVQTQRLIVEAIIPDESSLNELTAQCRIPDLTPPTAVNCSGETLMATTTTKTPIMRNTTITWTYRDAGNMTTQTQQVTIDDTTDPVPAEADLPTLQDCSQITSLTAPNAMDNCDGTITATTNVTPPIIASTTIMWTYRDTAGNMATQTQEVTIADTTDPVPSLSNNLSEITRQCILMQNELTPPIASDNCDGEVTATMDASRLPYYVYHNYYVDVY